VFTSVTNGKTEHTTRATLEQAFRMAAAAKPDNVVTIRQ
jgi:hypothetical protein